MSLKSLDGGIETVFTSDAYISNLFHHHMKLSIPALYLCSTIILLGLVSILLIHVKIWNILKEILHTQFPNEYFNYLKTNWLNQFCHSIFPSEILTLDILSRCSLIWLHVKIHSFTLMLKGLMYWYLNPFFSLLFYSEQMV